MRHETVQDSMPRCQRRTRLLAKFHQTSRGNRGALHSTPISIVAAALLCSFAFSLADAKAVVPFKFTQDIKTFAETSAVNEEDSPPLSVVTRNITQTSLVDSTSAKLSGTVSSMESIGTTADMSLKTATTTGENFYSFFDKNTQHALLEPSSYKVHEEDVDKPSNHVSMSCARSIIVRNRVPRMVACSMAGHDGNECFEPFSRIVCSVSKPGSSEKIRFPAAVLHVSVAQRNMSAQPLTAVVECEPNFVVGKYSTAIIGDIRYSFFCDKNSSRIVAFGCAAYGKYEPAADVRRCVTPISKAQAINTKLSKERETERARLHKDQISYMTSKSTVPFVTHG